MTAWRMFVLGLTVCVGCSSGTEPQGSCVPVGGPATDRASFGGIEYRLVGGISGRGDGTFVQIQPNGSVTRQTVQRGMEQGTLDPATRDAIIDKARAAKLPTLCTMYACADCADDFIDQVSVQFDGNVLTTRASQLADPPDRLQALIDALRAVVDRPL